MAGLDVVELRRTLETAVADSGVTEAKVAQMEAYMRNQFSFLGLNSPTVRQVVKPFLAAGANASSQQLLETAAACWRQPEREFQYTACLLLRKHADKLEPHQLEAVSAKPEVAPTQEPATVRELIVTKSWWDTVDSLSPWTVGPLVAAHPRLTEVLDRWINDDNIWLARTAILHQLGYRERTDGDRLFSYASARAEDTEFFIRKAIGWALRQHARQDPDAVRHFVATHEHRLSGLTKREALKHINN